MTDTERSALVQQLTQHEGLRLKPYVDTVGKITIGVGRNLSDVGLSPEEAMALLERDIDAAIADLVTFPWFPTLDAVRQRGVVDLRFNVGPSGFRTFRNFIHAMAIKDYDTAANELLTAKWAQQVGHRAVEVAAMIASGAD